jgi:hypothetical protein
MSKWKGHEFRSISKDVKTRPYLGTVGYFLGTNMAEVSDHHAELLDEAVKWSKENNPLFSKGICNWEALKIKKELEENPPELKDYIGNDLVPGEEAIDQSEKQQIKKDQSDVVLYVSVGDMDREYMGRYLRTFHNIDKNYKLYELKRKDVIPPREKRIEFQKENKSLLWFSDEFLEECLFVSRFPYGTGGYNSTYNKSMTLQNYAKMRLDSAVTDKFRRDYWYVFFINDWITKEKLYVENRFASMAQIGDYYYKTELEKEKDDEINFFSPMYYKLIGDKTSSNIKHSRQWQANNLQKIEAMVREYGQADIFITTTSNPADSELFEYLKQTALSVNFFKTFDCPAESAIYWMKKLNFLRKAMHGDLKKGASIFGH